MRLGAKLGAAIVVAIGCAALSVPMASAAAPANDDFANAKALGPDLPVETTATNVEATKEAEEPAFGNLGFAATGHSVWFDWEATGTGFVTVSTCGSQVATALAVYTGAAVNALTEIAGDFSSLGPDCLSFPGTAVTFKAIGGTTYEIGIDGRLSFPSAGDGLDGQGLVALKIDTTPLPPNDDLADATVLNGQRLENGIYAAGAAGFTWNATKEPGEPAHAGDPGGASVWYSWIAPSSDPYTLTACGRFVKSLLGVYTGNSVNGLTRVASDSRSCSFLTFAASLGTKYYIAVDGRFDSGTGSAAMGSISVNLYLEPPAPPMPTPPPPAVEIARPAANTTIRKRILRPARGSATFRFGSSQRGSTFLCRLDRKKFAACRSPKEYRDLRPGRHTFEVAASGAYGVDPTPAIASFKLARLPSGSPGP